MNRALGSDWFARGIQIAFVLIIIGAWDFVTQQKMISPIFLPPFRAVVGKFVHAVQTPLLYRSLQVTVIEVASAFAIAAVLGLLLGYLIGRSRWLTTVFEPLLAGIFAVPIIIFLPVFLLFFGIDMGSRIAFGATYAFFPVILNTVSGVANVDPRFVTVARSMGATEAQMFRRVLVPAALPIIVTALRIGFVVAFLSILGSEMIAGVRGLGTQIAQFGEAMNIADMFSYIVIVIVIAALINVSLTRLQHRFAGPAAAR